MGDEEKELGTALIDLGGGTTDLAVFADKNIRHTFVLALGGNKTRKLEFLLAEALARGCDCVVTAGAGQSNHCRQTAAAAARLRRARKGFDRSMAM